MRYCQYSIYVLLWIAISGCSVSNKTAVSPTSWESLQATLWIQHAAEYDALTSGYYQAAANNIDALLKDSSFSAIPDESEDTKEKKPAIIMDVDETVLDNSPFQARLIRKKTKYNSDLWAKWVNEENAAPVPGALEFAKEADNKGITIFYLTNRDNSLENATRNNLKELGFPIKRIDSTSELNDVILTAGERENWTSSKTERRRQISDNYRVIMIFGDDLNDFVAAKNKSEKERMELLNQHRQYFGYCWYMLPNPVYGSWEGSMMKPYDDDMKSGELIDRKIELLLPEY